MASSSSKRARRAAPTSHDARTDAPESGTFTISQMLNHGPCLFRAIREPELKGGFCHFTDDRGIERWISGQIMIVRD